MFNKHQSDCTIKMCQFFFISFLPPEGFCWWFFLPLNHVEPDWNLKLPQLLEFLRLYAVVELWIKQRVCFAVQHLFCSCSWCLGIINNVTDNTSVRVVGEQSTRLVSSNWWGYCVFCGVALFQYLGCIHNGNAQHEQTKNITQPWKLLTLSHLVVTPRHFPCTRGLDKTMIMKINRKAYRKNYP